MTEILTEENEESRELNPVTGILGNVSGSTWLTEEIVNISAFDGHSNGEEVIEISLSVESAQATGQLVWASIEEYDGTAITGSTVELVPQWDEIDISPYYASTSDGEVSGEELSFNGIGEVEFTGQGTVQTTSISTITDFSGYYTQEIKHNQTLVGEGLFEGRGALSGTINFNSDEDSQISECGDNDTMPENLSFCELSSGALLIDGSVNATGRYTSNGSTEFTQRLSHSSLVGSGIFETDTSEELDHYGTINGTGKFSGDGIFSGPMVQAGTFHLRDMIPGIYSVTAILDDGTRVELDDSFTVPSAINQVQKIDIQGSLISGKLINSSGEVVDGYAALLDDSSEFEDATTDCADSGHAPCRMYPNEMGDYGVGPLPPGNYSVAIDVDQDGFFEIIEEFPFDSEIYANVLVPSPIPEMFDLNFEMINEGSNVPDLNVSLSKADGDSMPVSAIYSVEDGEYQIELTPGEWIVDYALSDSKQVWEEFEVSSDMSMQFEFVTSVEVTGTVYYEENSSASFNPDDGKVIGADTVISFVWEGFSTTAMTNESGQFTVTLPEGAVVDATVEGLIAGLVNGTKFTVSTGMEDIVMVATPGTNVFGLVSVSRANNFYSSDLIGWQQLTVTAQNENYDVTWRKSVDNLGKFQMILPDGEWTFEIVESDIAYSPVTKSIDSENFSVEMILSPPNGTLSLEMFMDDSGDLNSSNGTPVSYDFEIVPSSQAGMGKNVTYDGSEWISEGLAQVSLEPGSYSVIVSISDATEGDLFGTMLSSQVVPFDIPLQGGSVDRIAAFLPEWRVSVSLTNQFGGVLSNQDFKLINTETGWTQTHTTDANGSWADHIIQGDWILSVESLINSEGATETLRAHIVSSPETASTDLSLSTIEAASVSISLTETLGAPLEGKRIVAASDEGLGEVDLTPTNSSGISEIQLFPGNWIMSMENEEDGIMWILESNDVVLSSGDNGLLNFTADRFAEVSGNVFWDLNDNGVYNIGEGINNATLTVLPGTCDENSSSDSTVVQNSDSAGSWS